ncbi:lyase family protein [Nonomuraea sp. NPDC050536]|uniref:lyase family protein n=1 Tax=Nonomuraea sp. NPDC050536 TaxID=3364366 RepID=UPI0037CCA711
MSSDLLAPVVAGTRVAGVTSDEAWVRAMLECEGALARAQARLGLIPASAAETITRVAASLTPDPAELALQSRASATPILPLLTSLRTTLRHQPPSGPGGASAAEFVHLGATSQDIVDSAAMLVSSRAVGVILDDLATVIQTLAALADTHRATVMAARTLGQHAVPTTFGLKAAGWLAGLIRARDALTALRFPAQLGGAAGTLAAMVERGWDALALVDLYAAELGLAAPAYPWHAERSVVSSLGAALAGTASALGKLATDVILLAQTEVGEVAESTEGGSSAMPHKRNSALSILIRSASLQVPAYAQVLYAVGEHERAAGAWQASWLPLRECLRLTGGATATAVELVTGLLIFPDKMRANAGLTGSGLVSERLAVHPDADQDPGGYLGVASELIDRILGEL